MPELRPIDLAEVRRVCPDNYSSALTYYKNGAVSRAWRTSNALHASVAGSAAQPYEASIGPRDDGSYWGRCTCPAARRQPICKHAAAVLVAWAEKPELFELRPEPEQKRESRPKLESEAKRARAPKTDRRSLLAEGLGKAESLLVDICSQGFLSTTGEQVEMIGSLAEVLEAHKLRRMARQVAQIREMAASAQKGSDDFDERDWARLLSDSWFVLTATRKALEKGEETDPTELEELVGKTWLEKDLCRVDGMELIELAYQTVVLPSGFRVETSYLLDLSDGALYTEKQITPVKLKKVPKKRSYTLPLRVSAAGVYPGYAPLRLKLIEAVEVPAAEDLWDRAIAKAETSAVALRQRLSQATASLVAPQEVYSLFRPASLLVLDDTAYLIDGEGKQIPTGGDRRTAEHRLRGALPRGPIGALLCRVRFTDEAMQAEPLSVVLSEGRAEERLIRLTA